ncbi:hypothetical protein B5G29_03205 [Akkermansia muciniphila]|nr:hypothetical protein B5G29_03205 [Akkermansia muciniphila]
MSGRGTGSGNNTETYSQKGTGNPCLPSFHFLEFAVSGFYSHGEQGNEDAFFSFSPCRACFPGIYSFHLTHG